jgi:hypothetical protein
VVQLRRILKSCLRDFAQLMLQVLAGGPKCRHHTCINSSVCLLKHVINSFEATYAVLYLYNAVCTGCFVVLQTIICEIFVAPVSIFVFCAEYYANAKIMFSASLAMAFSAGFDHGAVVFTRST